MSMKCIIMGNGPSLNKIDFEKLKDVDTFSVNSAYQDYEKWGFYPTYYSVIDHWTIVSIKDDLMGFIEKDTNIKRFFLHECIHTYPNNTDYSDECFNFSDKVTYIQTKWVNGVGLEPYLAGKTGGISGQINFPKGQWVDEIPKYTTNITLLPSVVPVTIQLAISLGYTEIGLVGVDARYSKENSHYKEDYLLTHSFNPSAGNDLGPYRKVGNYSKSVGVNIYSCTENSNVNSVYSYKNYLDFIK